MPTTNEFTVIKSSLPVVVLNCICTWEPIVMSSGADTLPKLTHGPSGEAIGFGPKSSGPWSILPVELLYTRG